MKAMEVSTFKDLQYLPLYKQILVFPVLVLAKIMIAFLVIGMAAALLAIPYMIVRIIIELFKIN